MASIIEKMSKIMQELEQARFASDVKIYIEMYNYKKATTLQDIEHNLEVLRRVTHKRIEKDFYEEHMASMFFDVYSRTGIVFMQARPEKEDKRFTLFLDPHDTTRS